MRSPLPRLRYTGARSAGRCALFGWAAVLIALSGCGVTAGPAPSTSTSSGAPATGSPAGAPAASFATSNAAPGLTWTRLTTPGIAFAHPASWHSFPEPLGVLPGPRWVVDVLTSGSQNPCSATTNPGGSGWAGCRWRLEHGGVEVMWLLQAQPLPMPATTTVIADRAAIRMSGPATGECRAAGGSRQLEAVLGGTGNGRDKVALTVQACLADPGATVAESQVNAMLSTLVPWS